MARRKGSPSLASQINKAVGQRRNMNGAGEGGRFVAQRKTTNGGKKTVVEGKIGLGSRDDRRRDLRTAFGLATG